MRLTITFPLLAALLLAAAPPVERVAGGRVGAPAPSLRGARLEGRPLATNDLAGKVVVLNFWATWCPPCRAETPDLIAAYRRLHAPDVVFLGIDTTDPAPIVTTFLSAKGVPFASALAGPALYDAFGISYIPTTIVLDRSGIVRDRWVGGVTPTQLVAYVAAARSGRSVDDLTPAQAHTERLLAPARFRFDGSPSTRTAVLHAIARADAIAAPDDVHIDGERLSRDEGALLIAAADAELARTRSAPARAASLALLAQGQADEARFSDDQRSLRAALALTPRDPQLLSALAEAEYRLHDYSAMLGYAQRYVRRRPRDGDGWSEVGLAEQRMHAFGAAVPPYARSLALLEAAARAKPDQDDLADVADTALDWADVEVALGDTSATRRVFDLANRYADRLHPAGPYGRLRRNVRERTQEGLVAVALGGRHAPVLSITPWTGADLPGSLASTLKYRLILAAPPGRALTLVAHGLRQDWVATFCADGLCAPFKVAVHVPSSGVKTYEFQLVPPAPHAAAGHVSIAVDGGPTIDVPRP